MREWPLIGFTLATQLACGLALGATLFDAQARGTDSALMRPLALAIFPAIAAGILLSMAHLGRPRGSWRVLANLRQSRLSREVLLTALFALVALAYSAFWWIDRSEGRVFLGLVTSAAGLAAVLAAAAVYTVPTMPAWNAGWVPASFLGTTLLLGGLPPAALLSWNGREELLRFFLAATVAGGLLLAAAALRMMTKLAGRSTVWLGFHVLLAGMLPIAVSLTLWLRHGAVLTPPAAPVLGAVLLGVAIGRAVMYWAGPRAEPF
jgi:anaerobic dimethyl sulfoxide reductase subunit C